MNTNRREDMLDMVENIMVCLVHQALYERVKEKSGFKTYNNISKYYQNTDNMLDDLEEIIDNIADNYSETMLLVVNANHKDDPFDIEEIHDAVYEVEENVCTKVAHIIRLGAHEDNIPFEIKPAAGMIRQ